MKKIVFLLVLCLLISCEQDIDNPTADYTWPVVHCLLNCEDTVHYLRLGKTFSGKDVEAMIHNTDSLYFKEANVYFDIMINDLEKKTIQLERVDDMERDPGVLPAEPFSQYRTTEHLKPGIIDLRIEIPEINQYVKASISLRGKPYFSSPDPMYAKVLDFYESRSVRIRWNGCPFARETIIRMWYLEVTENGRDTCKLDWLRLNSSFELEPNSWFELMRHSIKDDPKVKARKLLSIDFLASGGNYQYCQYLEKKDAAFDLIGQPYSNLTGAYGFVGSRAKGGIYGYMPDHEFLDSLSNLPHLKHLKFVHR